MKLRPYQLEALAALRADWASGLQRCGISSATGTGKTIMFSKLAHEFVADAKRVLILVHRDELVEQTVDKLRRIDPSVTIGVVKAARNSAGARIVIASVQTACRPKRLAQLGHFDLIICDEAHRSVSDQWLTVLKGLGGLDEESGVLVAGFSATWTRADKRGLDMVWQKISFELSMSWAITEGFLVRPRGVFIRTDIDLTKVKKTAGDYNAGDLEKKLTKESVRRAIVAGYLEHARDRSGVVFAPTVDTAEYFRAGFEAAGITTEGLYGITPREESKLIHKRHRSGETQLLVSCTKLSEGWDAPWCSAAVIARPTLHQGLFIQQIGRIVRPHGDKTDAVILDPTGVLFKHDLHGLIDLSSPTIQEKLDEDAEEELEAEPTEQLAAPGVDAHVSGFMEVDLLVSPWLASARGIRYGHLPGEGRVRLAVGPGVHEYPWWSVAEATIVDDRVVSGAWVATKLSESEAMRWIPRREEYPSRLMRDRPPNRRQKALAAHHDLTTRRTATMGELFDLISLRMVGSALDRVQSWS